VKVDVRGKPKASAPSCLLKLLALKFGTLDPSVQARVTTAGLEKLERWAERILTAERLEAVFEET